MPIVEPRRRWLSSALRLCSRAAVKAVHTGGLCVLAWSIASPSSGADYLPSYAPAFEINPEKSILGSRYGGNGLNWGEQDGAFFFRMQNRLQTRFSAPFDADPPNA